MKHFQNNFFLQNAKAFFVKIIKIIEPETIAFVDLKQLMASRFGLNLLFQKSKCCKAAFCTFSKQHLNIFK